MLKHCSIQIPLFGLFGLFGLWRYVLMNSQTGNFFLNQRPSNKTIIPYDFNNESQYRVRAPNALTKYILKS